MTRDTLLLKLTTNVELREVVYVMKPLGILFSFKYPLEIIILRV